MSSKRFAKDKTKRKEKADKKSNNPRGMVWAVRIVIVLLCIAVAVTLIPSVFF